MARAPEVEHRNQAQQPRHGRARLQLHFTPPGASSLNMVERFFRDLTVRRLQGGVFHNVDKLVGAIQDYLRQHYQAPKPFIWTARASGILAKVTRAKATADKLHNQWRSTLASAESQVFGSTKT